MTKLKSIEDLKGLEKAIKDGLRYKSGMARKTRFNAGSGMTFDHITEEPINTSKTPFVLVPIAYKIYTANMYNSGQKKWCELYYINNMGSVCFLQFHGFSVQRFESMLMMLVHEDVPNLAGLPIEIGMEKKTKQMVEEDVQVSKTYYILTFKPLAEKASDLLSLAIETIVGENQIYSVETINQEIEEMGVLSLNYNESVSNLPAIDPSKSPEELPPNLIGEGTMGND